ALFISRQQMWEPLVQVLPIAMRRGRTQTPTAGQEPPTPTPIPTRTRVGLIPTPTPTRPLVGAMPTPRGVRGRVARAPLVRPILRSWRSITLSTHDTASLQQCLARGGPTDPNRRYRYGDRLR